MWSNNEYEESWRRHPSSWTMVEQTAETILHLAELGYVFSWGAAPMSSRASWIMFSACVW